VKKYLAVILTTIFILATGCNNNDMISNSKLQNTPEPKAVATVEKKEPLVINFEKTFIRFNTPNVNDFYRFDFSKYDKSFFKESYQFEDINEILVDDRSFYVEVEILYNDVLDVKKSKWIVIPDPKTGKAEEVPNYFLKYTFNIGESRAIALYDPSLYSRRAHQSETSLEFRYTLKDGTTGVKSWRFPVVRDENYVKERPWLLEDE